MMAFASKRRPLIAFDMAPGNSGPGRYVRSLMNGLDASEFTVWHPGRAPVGADGAAATALETGLYSVSGGTKAQRSRLGYVARLLPSQARQCLGSMRRVNELAGPLNGLSVDILHTQSTGCEEAPVAARWARVPKVVGTFHVDSTYDLEQQRTNVAYRALEWLSNNCLHKAIAVSEATKRDWIRRTGISEHRVVTIYNGIDPEHFCRQQSRETARAALGLPQEALILAGVGRLERAKGFAYLIEALALLRPDFPQVLVAIAGDGQLRTELQAKADGLGVTDRVAFLGFQSDVNPVLDACDVFVMPSLCETLGYALLEAMAHELPAVGSQVGGIPEVIDVGNTGFLAPPRNAAGLANCIGPLLQSSALRSRLGRNGRLRVIKHFHERDMIRKTFDVYRRMLNPSQAVLTS